MKTVVGLHSVGLMVASTFLSACLAPANEFEAASQRVVYGEDDRTDVYAHPDEALRALARESIVALIRPRNLDETDPRDVRPRAETLGERRDLCEGERFADQPATANCSGTLVDVDLIVTAGHCVDDLADCENYRFVFDYMYRSEGVLETIDADTDVYRCREIVAREDDGSTDYAFVRLDRPVVGRTPAPVRMETAAVTLGQELVVIGFGSGIPAKIDDGGVVLDARAESLDYFGANLDTFGGNSGSGVFIDGAWAGILVRGEDDYEAMGDCQVVRTLPNSPDPGDDEDCTYGSRALEGLCATDFVTDLCEDTGGFCRACAEGSDCPADWECRSAGDDGSRFCAAPCGTCPGDHTCVDGRCTPDGSRVCRGLEVFESRCGRTTGPLERCVPGEVCASGACVEADPGDTCAAPIEIEPVDQTLTGRLGPGRSNRRRSRCGGAGPDVMYHFVLTETTEFTADAFGFDTVLYIRRQCDEPRTEVICDDDGGTDRGSRLELELGAGEYTLILDSYSEEVDADFTLDLTFGREAPPDAGVPDGGVDMGVADGGVDDAGDAGADAMDSGDAGELEAGGGCGCAVSTEPPEGVAGWVGLAVFVAWRRRQAAKRRTADA